MSVGGKVVETISLDDRVWVNTREPNHGGECAVYVERTDEARSIGEGDGVWWQSGWAFWAPKSGAFEDRRLNRIGCSGVQRPAPRMHGVVIPGV